MQDVTKRLVVGVLAHVDSGKTTLSEAMLYRAGAIRRLGRVDHRDAFLDTDSLERARGITIFSKQALFTAGSTQVAWLDTPGHVDFSAEAERTVQVLDYAVLVISGPDGVQSHTETLWALLRRCHVPTFLFINKMDLPGPGREAILDQLRRRLGEGFVDFGADAAARDEALALCDERLMEAYLAGQPWPAGTSSPPSPGGTCSPAGSARPSSWRGWTGCWRAWSAGPGPPPPGSTSARGCSRSLRTSRGPG